jgi:hypothetical protein
MRKDAKDRYQALLAYDLSEEELERVRQELKSGGTDLEDFIENRDLDLAEGELYNALELAIPKNLRSESFSEAEVDGQYSNIMSGMDTRHKTFQSRPSWRPRFSIAASLVIGAAIASLVIFLGLPLIGTLDDPKEIKEGASEKQNPERIRLMFNVGKREKGRPIVIERGVPGEKYGVENDVLIRYEIKKAGYVCLIHYLPSGKIKILNKNPGKLQKAGWHEIKESGQVQAVSLAGLSGTHSFYGIFNTAPTKCFGAADKIIKGLYDSDTIVDSFLIEVE